jgi:uncharacterized protein YndB with AHSA1/START domain
METLIVRRLIRATPERLFDAWTEPRHLLQWWGPRDVKCIEAEVDLRVGGAYRLANRRPDGTVVWISGTFSVVERPRVLVYSWSLDVMPGSAEKVTVTFAAQGDQTEVAITHERIRDNAIKEGHAAGWEGCLAKLAEHLEHLAQVE